MGAIFGGLLRVKGVPLCSFRSWHSQLKSKNHRFVQDSLEPWGSWLSRLVVHWLERFADCVWAANSTNSRTSLDMTMQVSGLSSESQLLHVSEIYIHFACHPAPYYPSFWFCGTAAKLWDWGRRSWSGIVWPVRTCCIPCEILLVWGLVDRLVSHFERHASVLLNCFLPRTRRDFPKADSVFPNTSVFIYGIAFWDRLFSGSKSFLFMRFVISDLFTRLDEEIVMCWSWGPLDTHDRERGLYIIWTTCLNWAQRASETPMRITRCTLSGCPWFV